MPQLNTVTVTDVITNAAVNFTPIGIDQKGVARLASDGSSLETQAILSLSAKRPSASGSQVFRAQIKLTEPTIVTDSATGATSVVSDNFVLVEFVLGKSSTTVDAQNLGHKIVELLDSSLIKTMLEKKVGVY